MRPERLLLVIDGLEVGGSQRQVQHLLACLDRERWQPELAYFRDDSSLADAIRASGVPVHYLPKRSRIDLRFLFAFSRLLRREDFALIHAYSLTAELWSVLARGLSGRRPLLIASERSFCQGHTAWYWRLKRFVLRRSKAVIANSVAGARAAAQHTGLPDALFTIVANGVELPMPISADERAAGRRALGVPEGRVMGLFVGRLVAEKNLPCLLRALAMIAPAQRPWIVLCGDGPLRASTEQLAAQLGLEADLCMLGERNDVTALMHAADFVVLPSHFEGLSNALLEAMAAGCPVVASAVGGTPELVDEERTGLLFPRDDVGALAAAMTRLAAEPELRSRLSRTAREYVTRNHGRAALAARTAAVYERCLAVDSRAAQDGVAYAHPARGHSK